MLTTGNDKLNDAAKQLVIIKQQKENILNKLCKNETANDSEGSDMSVTPTIKRKLHWLKITMGTEASVTSGSGTLAMRASSTADMWWQVFSIIVLRCTN